MTIGETTVPSSRTTRCSMVSGPKGNDAFGDPIRVDFPPHRMTPPAFMDFSVFGTVIMQVMRL